jgi:hypothetical protein
MAMLAPIECEQGTIKVIGIGQQRSDFAREMERESDRMLSVRLDRGAYQLAKREIRVMASALGMAADMVVERFDEWVSTLNVPDAPPGPNCHWREVHFISPEWTELARIGERYASIGTIAIEG